MSKSKCNVLFWKGFHADDCTTLCLYLIAKCLKQWLGEPNFDYQDLFHLVHPFFSHKRLKAEAIANAKNEAEAEAEITQQRKLAEEKEDCMLKWLMGYMLNLSIHNHSYTVLYRLFVHILPEAAEELPKPEPLPEFV